MITVTDLTKTFKSGETTVTAVNHLSFTVETGQFASIVGTSGSGKSTLLSLLGGLDRPDSGEVRVDDLVISAGSDRQLIKYRRDTIGFVFQNFSLIPNLDAAENVMLPMEFARVARDDQRARAIELLEGVGLKGAKLQRRPSRLSGGEQQRVAIARALANRPKLVLADEPTGNLDSKTGRAIVDMLRDLSKSNDTTVIVVTHDLNVAQRAAVSFRLEDGQLVSP
jgi:putative ABC transport system ATP-binding protein